MLLTTQLIRVFKYNHKGTEIPLTDPNPALSPQAVLNFYAPTYPELITAKVSGPEIKDDTIEFKFESVMGTKG